MNSRITIDIRIISSETLAEQYLQAMAKNMKRDSWILAEPPSYYPSRKQTDEVRIYTKWIKQAKQK